MNIKIEHSDAHGLMVINGIKVTVMYTQDANDYPQLYDIHTEAELSSQDRKELFFYTLLGFPLLCGLSTSAVLVNKGFFSWFSESQYHRLFPELHFKEREGFYEVGTHAIRQVSLVLFDDESRQQLQVAHQKDLFNASEIALPPGLHFKGTAAELAAYANQMGLTQISHYEGRYEFVKAISVLLHDLGLTQATPPVVFTISLIEEYAS